MLCLEQQRDPQQGQWPGTIVFTGLVLLHLSPFRGHRVCAGEVRSLVAGHVHSPCDVLCVPPPCPTRIPQTHTLRKFSQALLLLKIIHTLHSLFSENIISLQVKFSFVQIT